MSNRFISWAIFILLCFIWGSSFILMQESQQGLTGMQIAALRIFSAAIIFVPFIFFYISKLPRDKMGLIILTGVFGNLLPAFCFAIAISKIDSSLAGILNSLTPICVVTIGIVFFKDRIQKQKIIGVLIGLLGLCVTMLEKKMSLDNLAYSLLVVAGTISYGINVNLVSHHLKHLNALQLGAVSLGLMSIPSAFILWSSGFLQLDFADSYVQWAVLNSVLLGIVASSIATVLFYILVQKAGGLFASLVTYGIPFIALFWGFFYKESITVSSIIGLLIILVGVYLANKKMRNEK